MRNLFIGCAIAALATSAAYAQETTSSIRGTVTADGVAVAGATVTVTHIPSGTVSTTVTDESGGFSASGLRIGGPFTVRVVADSYPESSVTDISLTAGQPLRLPIALEAAAEEIVVTASSTKAVEQSTGPISAFDRDAIEGVASISRDIRDIARRDPFVTIDQSNSRALEIAGQNGRLNKFSVDGVRFSDNFGLNNGGLPTTRGPVPLDAIEQLSVKVAPYDVSEGDFQGGAINVVLRSGENDFTGSGFYTYTDDSLTGDRQGKAATAANPRGDINLDFDSKNYGGFVSGPIIKDKLFFAFSYERLEESRPADIGLAGAANVVPGLTQAQVDNVSMTAMTKFGYDTLGTYDSVDEVDEKYTAKIDWNISDSQRASATYIHNEGTTGNPQGSSTTPASPSLGLRSNAYVLGEKVDSGVFQLNSDWSDDFSTETRVNYRKTKRSQTPIGGLGLGQFTVCLDPVNPPDNPATVGLREDNPNQCTQGSGAVPGTPRIIFGADPSRQANALEYENYGADITARWQVGDHSLKAIASYSHLSVYNLFLQNALGTFVFDSLADYQAAAPRASSLTLAQALSGDVNDAAGAYSYDSISVALQDSWDITDTLNASFGFRYDTYSSNSRPAFNQNFFNRYGFANTETYAGKQVIQPRFSATWNPLDGLTLRGGIGLFAGGTPDVFLSNSFSNAGLANQILIQRNINATTGAVTCSVTPATLCDSALNNVNGRTFSPDVIAFLRNQPASIALANINAIDPGYKIASSWKTSLSADYETDDLGFLGGGWNFGGDIFYGWVNNAPNYTDLRSVQIGTAPDGRPRYGPRGGVATGNSDLLLFNTDQGHSLIAVGRINKSFDFGLDLGVSYTFQDVEDVAPITSSTAGSNYNQQAVLDPNQGQLGTSVYQIRNSFKFSIDYSHAFFGDYKTRFSLFGERRSGRAYSLTMSDNLATVSAGRGNVFGVTGQNNRFLLYVPQSGTDALVVYDTPATQTALDAFITSAGLEKFRGSIIPKNTQRAPTYTKIDLHVDQEIPVPLLRGARIKLFADLENVLNLIDSDLGAQRQVNFPSLATIVNVSCVPAAAGAPANPCAQYRYSSFNAPTLTLQNQNRQSLWGLRIGAKFEF